jgi:hypothetical protein
MGNSESHATHGLDGLDKLGLGLGLGLGPGGLGLGLGLGLGGFGLGLGLSLPGLDNISGMIIMNDHK